MGIRLKCKEVDSSTCPSDHFAPPRRLAATQLDTEKVKIATPDAQHTVPGDEKYVKIGLDVPESIQVVQLVADHSWFARPMETSIETVQGIEVLVV